MVTKKTKPRSKASFLPPDFTRITNRIKRLQECIAKHKASPRENSAQKIADCEASIAKYKEMLTDLQSKISETLAETD